jgi:hypothetical protein
MFFRRSNCVWGASICFLNSTKCVFTGSPHHSADASQRNKDLEGKLGEIIPPLTKLVDNMTEIDADRDHGDQERRDELSRYVSDPYALMAGPDCLQNRSLEDIGKQAQALLAKQKAAQTFPIKVRAAPTRPAKMRAPRITTVGETVTRTTTREDMATRTPTGEGIATSTPDEKNSTTRTSTAEGIVIPALGEKHGTIRTFGKGQGSGRAVLRLIERLRRAILLYQVRAITVQLLDQ